MTATGGERRRGGRRRFDTVFVLGLKGGIGKTYVCTNLAMMLASRGHNVGVIDADLPSPNVVDMFHRLGTTDSTTSSSPPTTSTATAPATTASLDQPAAIDMTVDHRLIPYTLDRIRVFSIAKLFENSSGSENGGGNNSSSSGSTGSSSDHQSYHNPRISISIDENTYAMILSAVARRTEWGDTEYFIVDMPAGSGYVLHTLMNEFRDRYIGSIIVAQEAHVKACERVIRWHMINEVPIIGVVTNMDSFICPKCHERYHFFGTPGSIFNLCKKYSVSYLGSIPLLTDGEMRQSQSSSSRRRTEVSTLFDGIARSIIKIAEMKNSSLESQDTLKGRVISGINRVIQIGKDELKKLLINAVVDIFTFANREIELSEIARRYGYKGGRDIMFTVVDDDKNREPLMTLYFIFADNKLKIVKSEQADPKLIVSVTLRALIGSLLGYLTVSRRQIMAAGGGMYGDPSTDAGQASSADSIRLEYSLIDAYFNGELVIHKYESDADPIATLKFIRDTWREALSHPKAAKLLSRLQQIASIIR